MEKQIFLRIPVSQEQKTSYVRAASPEKLNAWIRETLDAQAKKTNESE